MKIGVPREIHAGERRVATTPEVASQLMKMGFSVAVESGAGAEASFPDKAFEAAGCEIVKTAEELWAQSDLILKVRAPEADEPNLLRAGQTLISFVMPGQNPELLEKLTASGATVMAMDSVPRISRAQKIPMKTTAKKGRRTLSKWSWRSGSESPGNSGTRIRAAA